MPALKIIGAVSAAALFGLSAIAQETGREAQVFTPTDFTQFAPQTAFDMVRQIPGFSIRGDNDGSRGFGQASGNVLINGQRISGKSNSARDALQRIPAANVIRIEIVEGTTLDIPGLSGQVANIVAEAGEGISGTWSWESRFRENLPPYYDNVEVVLTGKRGALDWTFKAQSSPRRGASAGPEEIRDGSGTLTEIRDEDFTFIGVRPSVEGSLAWAPENGHLANLNASYTLWQPNVKEVSKLFPVNGPEGRRLFKRSEDEWNGEVGADYELGVGPGRLKAIGLVRRENSIFGNNLTSANVDGSGQEISRFDQEIDEGEYILRGEYAWAPRDGRDWQVAVESAFNYLDSEAAFFFSEDGGPLVEEVLDNASSRVEENRIETSVTYGRRLSPKWNLQTSLAIEQSEISQSGATGQTRTLTRPKGFISAAYAHSDTLTVTTRLEREVGQLNFFDFISSVNVNQGNDSQGNVEIVPEVAWALRTDIEKDFGDWGAVTIDAGYKEVEDLVDRIPIGDGDGPGNIDTAWRYFIGFDGTMKLENLGIAGAQIEAEARMAKSEVDDPLTGRPRRFNQDAVSYVEIEYRHDIPQTPWAYGLGFESFRPAAGFRLDERSQESQVPGFGFLFVQHKDIYGLTGTASLGNIFNQKDQFSREIFDGNRLGPVIQTEDRKREFGPSITIGLEGSF